MYKNLLLLFVLLILTFSLNAQTLTAPDGTTVTINRDDYGVPHIEAESETGVFFGQGFAIAADRLFQMESYRRMGEGTLAEAFGSQYLDMDIETRMLGYTQAERTQMFENAPEEVQAALTAYCSGINVYIDSMEANPAQYKPIQFANFDMQAWTVEKSIAVITFMASRFGDFGGDELTRLNELQNNGQEWLDTNRPINYQDAPTTINGDGITGLQPEWNYSGRNVNPDIVDEWQARKQRAFELSMQAGSPEKFGSFAVIVTPERAMNNATLMLGCPQMGAPAQHQANTICESELVCPEFHAAGMSIAGIPGVVIGRTDIFSWTLTSGISDNIDVYIDTTDSDTNIENYLFDNNWHAFEEIVDTISVLGQNDVIYTHYRSIHGPVFADDLENRYVYTFKKSTWQNEMAFLEVFYNIWNSESRSEFEQCISENPMSFNVFYADINGDIGYWHTGYYNDRNDGIDPRLPHFGDGSEEWEGIIPFEDLPHADGNDQPYFLNWNNKPVSWWNNGDNVPWRSSTHPVNSMFGYYDPISSLFSLEFIEGTPQAISDHGSWQQSIDWSDPVTGSNICPPGQSDFVNLDNTASPHKTDQWSMHQNWQFKEWLYDFEPTYVNSDENSLPGKFEISGIYPNPFNPLSVISINLPESSKLKVEVYNILGERVSILTNSFYRAGKYEFSFDAARHASGLYIVRAVNGQSVSVSRKMMLMK